MKPERKLNSGDKPMTKPAIESAETVAEAAGFRCCTGPARDFGYELIAECRSSSRDGWIKNVEAAVLVRDAAVAAQARREAFREAQAIAEAEWDQTLSQDAGMHCGKIVEEIQKRRFAATDEGKSDG